MAGQTPQQAGGPPLRLPSKLFTPGVITILVLMVIGYTLYCYAKNFTLYYLLLHPGQLLKGSVWQLLTFSLINSSCTLAFSGLAVLFLGSAIEREWGTRSFLTLWIVISGVCAIIWSIISLIIGQELIGMGSAPCIYGLIGTFGLVFRRQRFWFLFCTIEAQHLAFIFVGVGLVLGIAQPISWIWVAGAGVAYLYIKLRWRLMRGPSQNTGKKKNSFIDVD